MHFVLANIGRMAVWKKKFELDGLPSFLKDTIDAHLGIEYLEIGDDFLVARMPVDERTRQPFGLLHGGASAVLAESLGSLAGSMAVDDQHYCVGVSINANHLRAVTGGWVTGTVRPIRLGRRIHIWEIDIVNEDGKPVNHSVLTLSVQKLNA